MYREDHVANFIGEGMPATMQIGYLAPLAEKYT